MRLQARPKLVQPIVNALRELEPVVQAVHEAQLEVYEREVQKTDQTPHEVLPQVVTRGLGSKAVQLQVENQVLTEVPHEHRPVLIAVAQSVPR